MLDIQIIQHPKITLSQERVKAFLDTIYNKSEYKVIFSDKLPARTLGKYTLISGEITLYTGHFKSNNELMKTAIHELAHHIDYIKHGHREKPHTGSFKSILAYAESLAVKKGIFEIKNNSDLDNVFDKAMEFGKAILNYGHNPEHQHGMSEILKILKNPSKRSVQHYATLYNGFKGELG